VFVVVFRPAAKIGRRKELASTLTLSLRARRRADTLYKNRSFSSLQITESVNKESGVVHLLERFKLGYDGGRH
jgi:hypothetical protein